MEMIPRPKALRFPLAWFKELSFIGIRALLLLSVFFLGGCLENVSQSTPEDFIPDNNKIRYGRRLFQTICIKCHPPSNIRQYSDKQWRRIIAKKLKKDPLMMTASQTESLIYFLTYGNSGTDGFFAGGPPGESFTPIPASE